jgi:hypothetical protein
MLTRRTLEMSVRLDQAGDLRLHGGASMIIKGNRVSASDSDVLFLRVTPTGTQIQRTPFKA